MQRHERRLIKSVAQLAAIGKGVQFTGGDAAGRGRLGAGTHFSCLDVHGIRPYMENYGDTAVSSIAP